MAAFYNRFKAYSEKTRFLSYQKVLMEAMVVLWISSYITSGLLTQFFPFWRSSRTDPGGRLLGISWKLFGFEDDPAFWDRALAMWRTSNSTECRINIVLGYVGACSTLLATALLYLTFFCSLFVNRVWRDSVASMPPIISLKLEKFIVFWICGITPDEYEVVDGVLRIDDDRVRERSRWRMDNRVTGFRRYRRIVIRALCFVTCSPVHAVVMVPATFLLLFAAWLTCCLLPVVTLVLTATFVTVVAFGEQAVFPCYVLLVCCLSVYCIGSIMGFWKRVDFLNLSSLKETPGDNSVQAAQIEETQFETVVEQPRCVDMSRICGVYVFTLCCAVTFSDLFARYDLNIFDLSTTSAPRRCSVPTNFNLTNTLNYSTAILSYWVDTNLCDNFTDTLGLVSTVSTVAGSVFFRWLQVVIFFMLALPVGFLLISYLTQIVAMNRWFAKDAKSSPGLQRYPQWYNYFWDKRPEIPLESCINSDERKMYNLALATVRTLLSLVFLPWAFLACFLPERYHLPGYVLILTAFVLWILHAVGEVVWYNWSRMREHPHDPLGRNLLKDHPLRKRELRIRKRLIAEGRHLSDEDIALTNTNLALV